MPLTRQWNSKLHNRWSLSLSLSLCGIKKIYRVIPAVIQPTQEAPTRNLATHHSCTTLAATTGSTVKFAWFPLSFGSRGFHFHSLHKSVHSLLDVYKHASFPSIDSLVDVAPFISIRWTFVRNVVFNWSKRWSFARVSIIRLRFSPLSEVYRPEV